MRLRAVSASIADINYLLGTLASLFTAPASSEIGSIFYLPQVVLNFSFKEVLLTVPSLGSLYSLTQAPSFE
jgi:hypothetical protein